MISPAEDGSGFGDRVAEIKGGDCVEDEFERIGSVLAGFSRESVEAFGTLVDLQCPQSISPLASLCSRYAMALRAGRI
jgi:hypothetical protein